MRAPDFWRRRGTGALALAPLGALYGLSVALKAKFARPFDPGLPVICVGNLTAGGSGKTPIAIVIAERLRARGHKPFFLTRGYGGSERGPAVASRAHSAGQMGDEALLLARAAPTIVARDRAAGARLAKEKGASVLVMDDGHQNFALRKTLSLVVVDAETGFGNGLQIPAGPLREKVGQGLARANAVILMGSEHSEDGTPDLGAFSGPVLRAHLQVEGEAFAGKPVFAFAGIGRPEKFVASLETAGAEVVGSCFFDDHHPYTEEDIDQLKAIAGASQLVTTEKDFVRLTVAQREGIRLLKAAALFDDPAALDGLLDSALAARSRHLMSQSGDKLSLGERLRYGAEAGVFFAFMGFFKLLGPETASRIGGWIGRNLLSLLPPDRVARANLAAAFPEKSQAERNAIRRAMWDNLGRVVGEYPHLDRFSPHGEDPRITYSLPVGLTVEAMKGKPLMFLSAHLGNWEVMPILAHQVGLEGAAVVRPPNNPFVADWVARQRRINGPDTLIAKQNAVRGMLGQLRAGKMLCMLVDQKLREGIAVPFFGRDAMTTPAPAVLALKTGAQLVFASNQRLPGPRFHVTVWPDIGFVPSGNEAEDSRALTAAITFRIEEMIRADPAQWLWIHNRWPTERDKRLMAEKEGQAA